MVQIVTMKDPLSKLDVGQRFDYANDAWIITNHDDNSANDIYCCSLTQGHLVLFDKQTVVAYTRLVGGRGQ